jgi:hypothetical protein
MLIHTTGRGDGSGWVVLTLLGITLVGFIVVVIIKVNQAKRNQRSAPPEPPRFRSRRKICRRRYRRIGIRVIRPSSRRRQGSRLGAGRRMIE